MKNYIPLSRKYYEDLEKNACDLLIHLHQVIPTLRGIGLTEEEYKVYKDLADILDKRMLYVENLLEDENNIFYGEYELTEDNTPF